MNTPNTSTPTAALRDILTTAEAALKTVTQDAADAVARELAAMDAEDEANS